MTTEAKAPEAEYLRGYADGWHDGYATADAGLLEALEGLLYAVCHETGFAAAVRQDTGMAYPWEPLDIAEERARAAIAAAKGGCDAG